MTNKKRLKVGDKVKINFSKFIKEDLVEYIQNLDIVTIRKVIDDETYLIKETENMDCDEFWNIEEFYSDEDKENKELTVSKMTNGDYIRSMTDEEICENYMNDIVDFDCEGCPLEHLADCTVYGAELLDRKYDIIWDKTCKERILKWLKSDYKKEDWELSTKD